MAGHFRESARIVQGRILFLKQPQTAQKGLPKGFLVV
jgi:hypothetical protein